IYIIYIPAVFFYSHYISSYFLYIIFYHTTLSSYLFSFFFTVTATSDIYTLSLHDALPISFHRQRRYALRTACGRGCPAFCAAQNAHCTVDRRYREDDQQCSARFAQHKRSEEHTSELQSRSDLVCRLLLEKKKKKT